MSDNISPKSPKLTRRNPDKTTYHPFLSHPEFGIVVPDDAERIRLFKVPKYMNKTQKDAQQAKLGRFIMRNIPADQQAELSEKWTESKAIAKHRRSTFKSKIEADRLAADIKLVAKDLDDCRRKQRLHDFAAKKRDKLIEQAELLKQWSCENPTYAGQSATVYMDHDSDEGDASPPSFLGRLFSLKRHKYRQLKVDQEAREQQRAERELESLAVAKLDKKWKEDRAREIKHDKSDIAHTEALLKKLITEQKNAGQPERARSGSGGGKIAMRRKTRIARRTSTRRYK